MSGIEFVEDEVENVKTDESIASQSEDTPKMNGLIDDQSLPNNAWRVEFDARIKKKDEEENVKRNELLEFAKKELAEWYKNYHKEMETRRVELRKGNVGKHTRLTTNGMPSIEDKALWESVCTLCNFQTKQQKNVSRMQNILMSLKPTN